MVKEGKLSFFTLRTMFYLPLSLSFLFSSSSTILLLSSLIFYSLLTILLFSLLLHHLIYSIYFSIHKSRLHIDPISTLDSTFVFQHSFVNSETIYNHHHIVFAPPHFYCFSPPPPSHFC